MTLGSPAAPARSRAPRAGTAATTALLPFDAAVIGLGPVGATVAHLLAQQGLRVVAIDRSAEVFDRPRAVALDHESLRLLQGLGLAEAMAPMLAPTRPTEFRAADGSLLRRLLPRPEPNPLAWPANAMFVQPELDALLRARLAERPGVALRLGEEVAGLDGAAPDRVRLALRDPATGAPRGALEARWALCCDGAGSALRRMLGAEMESLDFDEPWVVVDALLGDEAAAPLPPTNVQYCHPARPTTFVHGPRNLRRWEFMLLPGEDPAAMAEEGAVWRLLAPWLRPGQARLWRTAAYRFHALVARPWRVGRAFLLGDAAHQTPPFMGQGLNQGLRDAANLAWKLALAARGGAGEALLDTYEAERRPNVRAVIAATKELGRIVCELDPARAAARDTRLRAEVAAGRGDVVRQDLLPPLRDGFLHRSPAGGGLSPGAGEPCPQPWLLAPGGGIPRRMDDALGGGFRLLLRAGLALPEDARAEAAALGARTAWLGRPPLVEADGLLAGWMGRQGGGGAAAVLVRPDHLVFGTAAAAAEVPHLLRAAAAALAAPARCRALPASP